MPNAPFSSELILTAINVVIALFTFWFQGKIRIAILELKNDIGEKYATKSEVERQIDLAGRIDRIPSRSFELMRNEEARGR